MSVTVERQERSIVQLEIEVAPERLESSKERAIKRISQQIKIPGFRPGKAPRRVVERTVGDGLVLQEALDDLIPDIYSEALAAEQIDAVGQPEIDLKSTDPVVVIARVPVRPTVDLGEYRALRVPRPEVEDGGADIDEAIDAVRRRFATYDPVERAIAWGDTVRADVTVSVDGQGEPHVEEDAEFTLREDGVISLPGFQERLIGLERGGPVEIEFTLPEDFSAQELAGKQAHYTVTIKEVKEEVLPDLDDAFVASLDEEGLATVDDLRARVTEQVEAQRRAEVDARYQEEVIDLLLATADIDYPDVLVDREVDRLIDQASNHASHTPEGLQEWLASVGQTEEEVRAGFRERADIAVRRGIVIGEFARAEGIEVTEAAIDAEIDRMASQMFGQFGGQDLTEEQTRQFRELIDTDDTRSQSGSDLLIRQAMERLVEICEQPEEERDDAASARRRGTRRRRARGEAGAGETDGGDPDADPDGSDTDGSDADRSDADRSDADGGDADDTGSGDAEPGEDAD